MQRLLHPEEQDSSLGISKALHDELERSNERARRNAALSRTPLADSRFKVPTEESAIYKWAVFYVSLYYNKLAVNVFGFVTGWKWYNRIDNFVILGALPTPTQVKSLHKQAKVDTIVNLCAEFPGYEKLYSDLNITQIRLETPDFTVPALDTIHRGIDAIIQRIREKPKNSIYLHCKGGKGRSAAIALCYLLRSYNLTLKESQDLLLTKRPQADKDIFKMDEIRAYYKDLISNVESGKINRVTYNVDQSSSPK